MNLLPVNTSDAQNRKIQVFLATYNRPHLIEIVIDSILNQTFNSYELIVSDNSTNDETKAIVETRYNNRVKYIHRVPSANEHFNRLLEEVDSEYFMMFHDDDIMLPSMLEDMYFTISQNENILAVGANAYLSINGRLTHKKYFRNSGNNMIISSTDAIVRQYLVRYGIVPFPSYLYRKKVAQLLRFEPSKGGKHCDAAFIMDITNLGSIVFLNKPLMIYTIHKGQDSQKNAFEQKSKLINYITRNSTFNSRNSLLVKFRIFNIYSELKEKLLNGEILIISKRYINLIMLIFKYLPLEYCFKILIISIYSQIKLLGSKLHLNNYLKKEY